MLKGTWRRPRRCHSVKKMGMRMMIVLTRRCANNLLLIGKTVIMRKCYVCKSSDAFLSLFPFMSIFRLSYSLFNFSLMLSWRVFDCQCSYDNLLVLGLLYGAINIICVASYTGGGSNANVAPSVRAQEMRSHGGVFHLPIGDHHCFGSWGRRYCILELRNTEWDH
ncbi:hypothetical protein L1049_013995 [Liquidambar formosana]|uniref:Uncharacterized protein n=1 Tax=Liquidambar formosana TaxID=63359 RepID=A0AAP0RPR5_LIQFO